MRKPVLLLYLFAALALAGAAVSKRLASLDAPALAGGIYTVALAARIER